MDLDVETKQEILEAFQDMYLQAESDLAQLLTDPTEDLLNSLFRSIHTIKGNAGIMGLMGIVDFTHQVEEVAGALRQKRYPITAPIANVLLVALDRLQDIHHQDLFGKRFEHLGINEFKAQLASLSTASVYDCDEQANQILHCTGAGTLPPHNRFITSKDDARKVVTPTPYGDNQARADNDLFFFQEMALHLDNQTPEWDGRSLQLFDWAMQMNQIAGSPVDSLQFTAAIYMHDLGLSFIPTKLWHKKADASPSELELITKHPDWGYQFLSRMANWQEAATIVLQHHECADGSGYPNGLLAKDIHPGAKILALLDTFFDLTQGRVDANDRKSTVRAVSTINARIDTAFDGLWVQCFNHMIRKELHLGHI